MSRTGERRPPHETVIPAGQSVSIVLRRLSIVKEVPAKRRVKDDAIVQRRYHGNVQSHCRAVRVPALWPCWFVPG